jgi:hypothetical protein
MRIIMKIGGSLVLRVERPEVSKINDGMGLTCPPITDPHVKLEEWIERRQGDEQEAVYLGADYRKATGSRSGVIC